MLSNHKHNFSRFAYFCDKLECDIQAKLYDEQGCVDLNNQEGNKTFENKHVQILSIHSSIAFMATSSLFIYFSHLTKGRFPFVLVLVALILHQQH